METALGVVRVVELGNKVELLANLQASQDESAIVILEAGDVERIVHFAGLVHENLLQTSLMPPILAGSKKATREPQWTDKGIKADCSDRSRHFTAHHAHTERKRCAARYLPPKVGRIIRAGPECADAICPSAALTVSACDGSSLRGPRFAAFEGTSKWSHLHDGHFHIAASHVSFKPPRFSKAPHSGNV